MFKGYLRAALVALSLVSMSCWADLTPAELMNTTALRSLGQRIAKSYMMIGSDVLVDIANKQLRQSIESFEHNKQILSDNAPNADIRDALVKLDKTWQDYKALVQAAPGKEQAVKVVSVGNHLLDECQKITDMLEKANGDKASHFVNRSGRDRLMSQRIAMLYLARSWDVQAPDLEDAFNASVKEFETVLDELKEAGTPNQEIAVALRKVEAQWKFTTMAAGFSQPNQFVPTAMATSADKLYDKVNDLTRLYAALPVNQ